MKAQLILLTAACIATAALAQQPPQSAQGDDPFTLLDVDQSGGISTQEAQASTVVAQSFASADRNADGILGREEFDAAFQVARPQQPGTPAPPPSRPNPSPPQ